jgi:hypothetical protein
VHLIDAGFQIVFSTTNYYEGAEAFVEILVEQGLITKYHQAQIISSGSLIDWKNQSIIHFNIGADKSVGVSKALKIPLEKLPSLTDSAYGDDPLGNDVGILSLAAKAFVIANQKNFEVLIPVYLYNSYFMGKYSRKLLLTLLRSPDKTFNFQKPIAA